MRHWCNLRKKWCQFKTGSKFNSRLTPNDKNAVNVVLLKKDEKTFDKCQVSIEKKTKNVANVSNFAERLKRPLMTTKAWIASTDIVTWKRDPGTFQRVSQCQPEPFPACALSFDPHLLQSPPPHDDLDEEGDGDDDDADDSNAVNGDDQNAHDDNFLDQRDFDVVF